MNKPAVFVSSTCYDLKQVRSDIKQFLEELGLDPVLSEYSSFPVSPDLGTVDNCVKAVETRADIFILIVGARYGSTTDRGESITNLEFLAAKAKGIPVYVFVMRSVLDILPVWQASPDADYSGVVDSSKLLNFVAELKGTKESWVFPFDTAQDIFEALRAQFAYLFMDALGLRLRVSKAGGLSPRFKDLPGSALRLLIERPSGWEYLLFTQVLDSGIRCLSDMKRDWQYRLALGPGTRMRPSEFMARVQDKCAEARRVCANLTTLLNVAWPSAIGPHGKPADPEAIVYVAERIAAVYRNALDWKLDFERLGTPEELCRLKSLASCLCDNMVAEVEEYSSKLKALTSEAVRAARLGQKAEVKLTLTLTAPDLTEYTEELRRVTDLYNSGAREWK
jgi:hypothetical protein